MTRARPHHLLLLASLLVLPGCLQAEPFFAASAADATEYRLVLLSGAYTRDEKTMGACGFASTPEIDEANRTILFHNEAPPANARALVLSVVWSHVGCGTAATSWATLDEETGLARIDVAGIGEVGIEFRDDGSVHVDGQPLQPGGLTIDAEGRGWNATAAFRDLGMWPSGGIRLV